jgi:lysophospholipase L1-like esterase
MSALGRARSVLLLLGLAVAAYPQAEPWAPVDFTCAGKPYRLTVRCFPSGESYVVLSEGTKETVLGETGGENVFPVAQVSGELFHVLWVHYRDGFTGLGLYDSATGSSRSFPLPGMKFAGSPALIEKDGWPAGLVFLGNGSDNDDVFFLDLLANSLTNVTQTRWSEKAFATESGPEGIVLRTISLRDRARYLLSPGARAFRLLGRESIRSVRQGPGSAADQADQEDCRPANTYVAFGDSITYGKMRMDDLEGEIHPELAYPERMREKLAEFYGPAYPLNLGVLGDSTYGGALRVDQDLTGVSALYFLLMLGTNDCISNSFSVDSSIENLAYIVDSAASRHMRVIVSTIPPRKDRIGERPFVQRNIADFNAGTAALATDRGIGYIDTYGAFMSTDPPDGWKALLEDIGGNHASPAGHLVIASLFAGVLAGYPPLRPSGVENVSTESSNSWRFGWDPGCESDLSHYRVEFGTSPRALIHEAVTSAPRMDFRGYSSEDVFFRVQAVDMAGNAGSFTRIYNTAGTPGAPHVVNRPLADRRPPR